MSKPQPDPKRVYASIAVPFAWLVFLALWLFYYASSFSILQNIAVFLLSIVVVGIIMIIVWVPWAMKHAGEDE
jgi:hypothetical protein